MAECPGRNAVRATRDFDPNSPDEIEIEKNDTIELQQRYNDGWGFGRNMRTGQHGVFPLNHVKPLSQREAEAIQSMFNGPTSGSDFHYGSSSSHASASRQAGDERHRNATVAGPVPKLTLQFEMEPADSVSDECMKLFDDIMTLSKVISI
ncbi:polar growth protein [Sorochytrium milnesiophthora]